jgi:translation initiation factor 1
VTKREKSNSKLVYSTESGRLCPQCHRPVAGCVCGQDRPADLGDGVVRIRRETKGRGGKAVTVISGIPLAAAALKNLTKELKKRCGVGGSSKDGSIEIQGDQREVLKLELEKRGYRVKLSGG